MIEHLKLILSKLNKGKKHKNKGHNDLLDDYIYRYPPFPKGIPSTDIELIISNNNDMIIKIIQARGLSGKHNANEVNVKILGPIRHLANMVHLLPMSENTHYRTPGGLFGFSLESALFAIRHAERRVMTRITPELRRENESLWTQAAFLAGLFSEAILVISTISVYSEDGGIEWHPGTESISQWLKKNKLKSYHLKWSDKQDRSMIYALAGKVIQTEQAEMLATGEKAIYKTLLSALHEQDDLKNPLVKIVLTIKYNLIERDQAADPSRYGKPLTGMHLDPWLIDAMRHLVEKNRWVINEENGRLWCGIDGIYLIWPLSANDIQYQLKDAESPFVPNTKEILAELMLEAGIIDCNNANKGYLFDIGIPQSNEQEKKYVSAIRLSCPEILFDKSSYEVLNQPLEVGEEENDENIMAHEDHEDEKIIIKTYQQELLLSSNSDPETKYNNTNSLYKDGEQEQNESNHYDTDYISTYSEQNPSTYDEPINHHIDQDQDITSLIGKLIGEKNNSKPKRRVQKDNYNNSQSRSSLILDTLKTIPDRFLQSRPGGITKITTLGLRDTKLELHDCISVLKAAELLVMVDGLETGIDQIGNKQVQYFLVKANLLDVE